MTSSTGTHTGRFGYGGPYGYQEDEGGLKQLGHRLYDPVCGGFVTKDPIKDGRNWYAYCGNKPITRGDADGTIAFLLVPLIIVAGAVLCGGCGCSAQDAADAGQTGLEHGVQPEPAGSVAAGADAVSRVPYKEIDKDQQQTEDLMDDPYDDENENKLEYDQDGQGHRHIMKHKRKKVQPAPDILEN